jgi:putrescine transport system ATP-binding protein
MANVVLEIEGLSKMFTTESVFKDLRLQVNEGEVLSILGASGSGKTTLLKVIAGLEAEDEGDIRWKGKRMNKMMPQDREIIYLYQEPLLFPHLNVFENVAFGLRLRKVQEKEINRRVEHVLTSLGIESHARKSPEQLSGGQKQRVAFGRALIIQPKMILLDEPFGALDHDTRRQMQQLLRQILENEKMTAIFVTHDIKEAIQMGNRIGKMERGNLHIYPSLKAFVEDPGSGAQEEGRFWKNLL